MGVVSSTHPAMQCVTRAAGIGEGVKIADLNGQLLFYSKDHRLGRDHETVFEANGQPVGTLQKKMLSTVRLLMHVTLPTTSFCMHIVWTSLVSD